MELTHQLAEMLGVSEQTASGALTEADGEPDIAISKILDEHELSTLFCDECEKTIEYGLDLLRRHAATRGSRSAHGPQ